jgi:hypothetical protein
MDYLNSVNMFQICPKNKHLPNSSSVCDVNPLSYYIL